MAGDNYRNTLMEAKHQRDLMKDYFNHVGALVGAEGQDQPRGHKKLASISPFQDYPIIPINFYLIWCCSNFEPIPKENPIHFQQV